MCGRFHISAGSQQYAAQWAADSKQMTKAGGQNQQTTLEPPVPTAAARPLPSNAQNFGPSNVCDVVIQNTEDGCLELREMKWGLIPAYEKDENYFKMFNARSESADTKTSFKGLLKNKRCIVVCAGYFEWVGEGAHKRPFYISLENSEPLLCAALYDFNRIFEVLSFSMITTAGPPKLAAIHNRAPLVLTKEQAELWLTGDTEEQTVLEILRGETLLAQKSFHWPVTKEIGKGSYQGLDCSVRVEGVASPKKQLGIGSFFKNTATPSQDTSGKKRPREGD